MLTPEQESRLRNRLVAERERFATEISALVQSEREKADCSLTDPADAAAYLERRHRAAALRAQREATLEEIDAALLRLEQGRYGISESSGEPIPFERLEAVPWARSERHS